MNPIRLIVLIFVWRYKPTMIDPMWRVGPKRLPWHACYRRARQVMDFDAAAKAGRDPWAAYRKWEDPR